MNLQFDGRPICFLDSGVGGLTVLYEALQFRPKERYIYFADSQNAPYGKKPADKVGLLVFEAAKFLSQFNPKALVLACNTATGISVDLLRSSFSFPIIGMEPAVKPALDRRDNRKVLILGTENTLNSTKFTDLIYTLNAAGRVDKIEMSFLVDYAENFEFTSSAVEDALSARFAGIRWNEYHSVVLGCTHFNYFIPVLRRILPDHISIIHGNVGTVRQLFSKIQESQPDSDYSLQCFLSSIEVSTEIFSPFLNFLGNKTFTGSLLE